MHHSGTLMLLSVCLASCQSVMKVRSIPAGAEVVILDERGKEKSALGVTPLDVPASQQSDLLLLEFRKNGFYSKQLAVPGLAFSEIEAQVKLATVERSSVLKNNLMGSYLNDSLRIFLEIQSYLVDRKLEEAKKIIDKHESEFQDVSFFVSLIGNYYYLSKNKKKAIESYRRAFNLDPSNTEAKEMLGILGGGK